MTFYACRFHRTTISVIDHEITSYSKSGLETRIIYLKSYNNVRAKQITGIYDIVNDVLKFVINDLMNTPD